MSIISIITMIVLPYCDSKLEKMAFDRYPFTPASSDPADLVLAWEPIRNWLCSAIRRGARVIAVECYPGVDEEALARELVSVGQVKRTSDWVRFVNLDRYLTDDPVFGRMCDLEMADFFDSAKIAEMSLGAADKSVCATLIVGAGATLACPDADLLVYADMPRWEIQQRQRRGENPALQY